MAKFDETEFVGLEGLPEDEGRVTSLLVPPIIIDGGEQGAATLSRFIELARSVPNERVSAQEAERLTPYLAAFEKRITSDTKPPSQVITDIVFDDSGKAVAYLPAVQESDAESLKLLFNKVADDSGNTIVSEFAIIPVGLLGSAQVGALEAQGEIKTYMKPSRFNITNDYYLGFIKCLKPDQNAALSFPVVGLDTSIMADIGRYKEAQDLLSALRHIATESNHDMLHHLTSPVVLDEIAGNTRQASYAQEMGMMVLSYAPHARADSIYNYESWALNSHARTWRELRGSAAGLRLEENVDHYFDALDKIDAQMASDSSVKADDRSRIVDYFCTAAAYSLLRIVPMADPLMQHALDRMDRVTSDKATLISNFIERKYDSGGQYDISYSEKGAFDMMRKLYLRFLQETGYINRNVLRDAASVVNGYNNMGGKIASASKREFTPLDASALEGSQNETFSALEGMPAGPVRQKVLSFLILISSVEVSPQGLLSTMKPSMGESFRGLLQRFRSTATQPSINMDAHDKGQFDKTQREFVEKCCSMMLSSMMTYIRFHLDDPDSREWAEELNRVAFCGVQEVIKSADPPRGRDVETLRNYYNAGTPIVAMGKRGPTYKDMKVLQLLNLASEIPYVLSPRGHDAVLDNLDRDGLGIDKGVVNILSGRPGITIS